MDTALLHNGDDTFVVGQNRIGDRASIHVSQIAVPTLRCGVMSDEEIDVIRAHRVRRKDRLQM